MTSTKLRQALQDLATICAMQDEQQAADRQAIRELLPTETPGVQIRSIRTGSTGLPEIVCLPDTELSIFDVTVKTSQAKATVEALRTEFDGLATVSAVNPK